jgi:hypothetical protein
MKPYNIFLTLIIFVKIIFIILALVHQYLKFTNQEHSELDTIIEYWKTRIEFVFVFLMALLLMYLFNPQTDKKSMIDKETQLILFLFGVVLIVTADWSDFIKESIIFKTIQKILGGHQ